MSDVSAIRCLHIRDEDRRAWGRAATGRNEERILRRRPDSNWGIELLQSSALPLGYVALSRDTGFLCGDCVAGGAYVRLHTAPPRHLASRKNPASSCVEVFRMSVGRFDLFYIFLWSGWRESNPRVNLGKVAGYHYITPASGEGFVSPQWRAGPRGSSCGCYASSAE